MSPMSTTWTVLGTLMFGLMLGSCIGGGTEVKVVHVPEVKTRVVEKQVHTTTPLPESCRDSITQVHAVLEQSGAETESAGQILLALQDMGGASWSQDISRINHTTAAIRSQKDRLDSAVIRSQTARQQLQEVLAQCDTALAK